MLARPPMPIGRCEVNLPPSATLNSLTTLFYHYTLSLYAKVYVDSIMPVNTLYIRVYIDSIMPVNTLYIRVNIDTIMPVNTLYIRVYNNKTP